MAGQATGVVCMGVVGPDYDIMNMQNVPLVSDISWRKTRLWLDEISSIVTKPLDLLPLCASFGANGP